MNTKTITNDLRDFHREQLKLCNYGDKLRGREFMWRCVGFLEFITDQQYRWFGWDRHATEIKGEFINEEKRDSANEERVIMKVYQYVIVELDEDGEPHNLGNDGDVIPFLADGATKASVRAVVDAVDRGYDIDELGKNWDVLVSPFG